MTGNLYESFVVTFLDFLNILLDVSSWVSKKGISFPQPVFNSLLFAFSFLHLIILGIDISLPTAFLLDLAIIILQLSP